ncbi:MAG: hypothetical protein A3G33_09880 [Omnitrophica bacterium RIFCSPLOWO2_12_FULL_44_17]|uniref:Major facilitator superfamily (MFS) profile domain-containing protein n=1 Tax=Candidatus Danuiimicrobium aquiferis TaxID=1801832 RepID=A0A1G1L139_9BACT|nr:MAG: hypothetical protein A3B72_11150 [Omnitrophica bacterium RIFCSPHIGHO2_02_FULL_45_28]OGW98856.1 MAG: hypothetical protein A3G33_09880 [Omnitrophica bacterium RIFCSPLOWO2_12_FULL_44_17]OGX04103.1 MAG: hypothetical protein A3J12_02245 [Omnitrophica bacterium RIFCSPLOWO2_02_FULL_44_11]
MSFSSHFISPNEKHRKSLEISWKEGIPASFMQAIVDYYITPLGLLIGATPFQIGCMVSLPQLLGAVSQTLATKMIQWLGSRLQFLVRATLIQALLFAPIAVLSLSLFPGRIYFLIFLMIFFQVFGNLINTVWSSLVSDYLKPEQRGRYFGWRSRIAGCATLTGIITAGIVLYLYRHFSPSLGFLIVFLFALAARLLSSRLMSKMDDLPITQTAEHHFTFLMFLARFRKSNFVKFTIYVAGIIFCSYLASPYFSVFMLRDLRINYLSYMIVHLTLVISAIIAYPIWGKHADVIGNAKILKVTGSLIPLCPLLWVFSHDLWYLILIQIFGGFLWGGFNLCTVNFIYDSVSPGNRVRCLSYFNLINGTAIFCGAAIGGILAERLPPFMGYRLLTLFMLSGFLRYLANIFLSTGFNEIRGTKKKISSIELFFSVIGIKPLTEHPQE